MALAPASPTGDILLCGASLCPLTSIQSQEKLPPFCARPISRNPLTKQHARALLLIGRGFLLPDLRPLLRAVAHSESNHLSSFNKPSPPERTNLGRRSGLVFQSKVFVAQLACSLAYRIGDRICLIRAEASKSDASQNTGNSCGCSSLLPATRVAA
jgi:hypothetical protein